MNNESIIIRRANINDIDNTALLIAEYLKRV